VLEGLGFAPAVQRRVLTRLITDERIRKAKWRSPDIRGDRTATGLRAASGQPWEVDWIEGEDDP
jgi:hypothetical protein